MGEQACVYVCVHVHTGLCTCVPVLCACMHSVHVLCIVLCACMFSVLCLCENLLCACVCVQTDTDRQTDEEHVDGSILLPYVTAMKSFIFCLKYLDKLILNKSCLVRVNYSLMSQYYWIR